MGGIVLDTSAVIALIWDESTAPALRARLATESRREISASSYVEAASVLMGRSHDPGAATELLREFIADSEINIASFDAAQAVAAVEASRRFGKGRHPARLNLGDCFAYALAKVRGAPLLYVGDDFARTDIEPALV